MGGEEGNAPDEWDYGAWQEPTMGVELIADDGDTHSAVWGSTFDHYGNRDNNWPACKEPHVGA